MNKNNTRLIGIIVGFELLLLIPYIAMRLTNEVVWTAADFLVMGALLLITALGVEVALRTVRVTWMKVAAVAAVIFGFVMVWGTLVHLGG
jgi:hypothetical protein